MYLGTLNVCGTPEGIYAAQQSTVNLGGSFNWSLGTTQYSPPLNVSRTTATNDFALITNGSSLIGGPPTGCISSSTNFYVATTGNDTTGDGSSGNPWLTVGQALNYLGNFWINEAATVTIWLADGSYTLTSTINVQHPCGARITIQGTNSYNTILSSIASSSGSAGAWSYVLNMAIVANIAVGDYMLIKSVSGGTNPLLLCGCHKVTAVGSSTITVLSTSRYSSAASGVVTGTITNVKTVINVPSNVAGLTVSGMYSLGLVDVLAFAGNATSNTSGIVATHGGSINLGATVGVAGCYLGASAQYGGILSAGSLVASGYGGVGLGLDAYAGGVIQSGSQVTLCGYADGISSAYNTYVELTNAVIVGCLTYGVYCSASSEMLLSTPTVVGTPTGLYCYQMSTINVSGSMGWSLGTTQYNPTANTARTFALNDFALIT